MTCYELQKALKSPHKVTTLVIHLPEEPLTDTAFRQMPNLQNLTIKGQNINAWPQSLATHSTLSTLNIQKCHFSVKTWQLPPQIKNLSLSNCQLKKLPELPTSLEELQIENLQITKFEQYLPDLLAPLKKLQSLRIINCELKKLPKSTFKNPNKLKILNLSHNKLRDIDALNELENLFLLDLSFNKIQHLPKLHATCITASKNALKSISPELLQSPHLHSLNISQNKIENLPPLYLPQITELDLSQNPLTQWPSGLEHSKQLRKLYLGKTRILSLPDPVPELPALETLDLNGYAARKKNAHWPQNMHGWKNLKTLHLQRCGIKQIPPSFWHLQNMNGGQLPPLFSKALTLLKAFKSIDKEEHRQHLPEIWGALQNKTPLKTILPRNMLLRLAASRYLPLRKLAEEQLPLNNYPTDKIRHKNYRAKLIGKSITPTALLKTLLEKHGIILKTDRKNPEQAELFILCSKDRPLEIKIPEDKPLFSEAHLLQKLHDLDPLSPENEEKILLMLQSGDKNMVKAALKLIHLYGPSPALLAQLSALKKQSNMRSLKNEMQQIIYLYPN